MFLPQIVVAVAGLVAATEAEGLPTCYISPYALALNTTTCGPLDVGCCCQSQTYLSALQDDVPQACDTTDQVPIFSYIMAACSEFGVQVDLSTTSVDPTATSIPSEAFTVTVTSLASATFGTSFGVTGTQVAAETGTANAVISDCPKPDLSTGASIGLIIAAFALGGLLFAAAAVVMMRRRKINDTRPLLAAAPEIPHTPYTISSSYSSQFSHIQDKPPRMFEATTEGSRVELMSPDATGYPGRPAELSS